MVAIERDELGPLFFTTGRGRCRGAKARREIGCIRAPAVQLYRRYGAAELNLGDASSELFRTCQRKGSRTVKAA
jgi:hypothetical protein